MERRDFLKRIGIGVGVLIAVVTASQIPSWIPPPQKPNGYSLKLPGDSGWHHIAATVTNGENGRVGPIFYIDGMETPASIDFWHRGLTGTITDFRVTKGIAKWGVFENE